MSPPPPDRPRFAVSRRPRVEIAAAFGTALLAFGACAVVAHLASAPSSQWLDLRVLASQLASAAALAGAVAVIAIAVCLATARRVSAPGTALVLATGLILLGQSWAFLDPLLSRVSPALGSGHGATGIAAAAAAFAALVRAALLRRGVRPARMLLPWVALLCLLPIVSAALASGVEASVASRRVPFLALLALALGLAILRAGRLRGVARFAAIAALLAVALTGLRLSTLNPHDRVVKPGPATAGKGPNVILIALDTFRADAFDPTGARTPNLARFAAHADVHTHAIANGSWTLPGHASLFTGRFLAHHHTDLTTLPGFSPALAASYPTAAELFGRAGWSTACISANAIVGLRNGVARGCQRYQNPGRAWLARTTEQRLVDLVGEGGGRSQLQLELFGVNVNATADEIVDLALREVDEGPEPFFLFLNFLDVHGPYTPPPSDQPPAAAERRAQLRDQVNRLLGRIDEQTLWKRHATTLRSYYDGQVRVLDRELGRLFDELERRGRLDDSIVVITADHGEGFFENPDLPGYFGHHSAYEPSVRIPLIVMAPGQREGRVSDRLVQQADVLPTLLALAGLPPLPDLDGRSLVEASEGPVVTEWYTRREPGSFPFRPDPRRAIYEGPYKYVRDGERGEFLYDLARSPYEAADVLAEQPETAARLRAALDAALSAPAAKAGDAKPMDPGLRDQLRALGYVE